MLYYESIRDTIVFVCCCALAVCHATIFLPRAGSLLRCWRQCIQRSTSGIRGREQDLFPELVEERLAMKRKHFARQFVYIIEALLFSLCTVVAWNIGTGSIRWMSLPQEITSFIAYAIILFATTNFSRMTQFLGKYSDCSLYTAAFVTVAMFIGPWATNVEMLQMIVSFVRFPRLFLAAVVLDVRLVAASNVLYFILLSWSVLSTGTNSAVAHPRALILNELLILVMIISAATCFTNMITNEVKQELAMKAARTEQSAARALLQTICDLCLEIDQDLRMVEHFPRLSAILMLDPGRSLKGANIQQFMPQAEERDAFQKRLMAPQRASDCLADVFHVTMRDSNTSNIRMEVFTVKFTDLSGNHRHLVGMREYTDVMPFVTEHRGDGARRVRSQQRRARRRSTSSTNGTSDTSHAEGLQGGDRAEGRLGGGTPSEPERIDLASHEPGSPRSSVSSTSNGGARRLQFPHMRDTSLSAKRLCLLRVLCGWNTHSPLACCPLHAALREMQSVLKWMVRSPCEIDFLPEIKQSCASCGLLDDTLLPGHEHGTCIASSFDQLQHQSIGEKKHGGVPPAAPPPQPQDEASSPSERLSL